MEKSPAMRANPAVEARSNEHSLGRRPVCAVWLTQESTEAGVSKDMSGSKDGLELVKMLITSHAS
jgi:hypothetical protein